MKWLLAIPHYIVLPFLSIAAVRGGDHRLVRDPVHRPLPAGLFDFVEGFMRWRTASSPYAFTLVTDKYPPFRFSP